MTRALEYANRAMVLLASNHGQGPLIVAEIAKATAAPPNFLHQVLNNLARAGLLVSHRGARRGYELARDPAEISLLDVFEVIEGPVGLTCCTVEGNWCPRDEGCNLAGVWNDVQQAIVARLKEATLDELALGQGAGDCPVPVE
ncbi:MAG: RrF2 family transcriptional regulator [Planctomycetota bacterium]